jgi:hypothetical protein
LTQIHPDVDQGLSQFRKLTESHRRKPGIHMGGSLAVRCTEWFVETVVDPEGDCAVVRQERSSIVM